MEMGDIPGGKGGAVAAGHSPFFLLKKEEVCMDKQKKLESIWNVVAPVLMEIINEAVKKWIRKQQ